MSEVVYTLTELRNTPTYSSGAADPTYDAVSAAHQNAKNDMITNNALIRGTQKSHRIEFENAKKKIRKAATTPAAPAATTPASTGNPAAPSTTQARQGVGGPAAPPKTAPLRDNIFSGVKSASAYLHISENQALQWPSAEDRASLTERISVSALRAGMVLPTLHFGICDTSGTGRLLYSDSRTSGQFNAPIDDIQEPGMRARTPTVPQDQGAHRSILRQSCEHSMSH